jgi:chromosome segregation ATPase
MSSSPTFSRSSPAFSRSSLSSLSSPPKRVVKKKNHLQDLRQILQQRMVELQRAKSKWLSQEVGLHDSCKAIESQLRDLDTRYASDRAEIQSKHVSELTRLKQRNQKAIRSLEESLEKVLSSPEDPAGEGLDDQITSLADELSRLEDAPEPQDDLELLDSSAEERIQQLQDRLDDVEQMHEEILRKRDDDSRKATEMLTKLIEKHEREEADHQEALRPRVERLDEMDAAQSAKLAQIGNEAESRKARVAGSLKGALAKIQQLQQTVAKRQRDYEQTLADLQAKADDLRADLKVTTARQQEQIKIAVASAKKYAEERRKHVALNRKLEMLQAEKMKEAVENAALKKDISKKDGYVLSQIGARSSPQLTASARPFAKTAPH